FFLQRLARLSTACRSSSDRVIDVLTFILPTYPASPILSISSSLIVHRLPYCHHYDMVSHMKTTLNIDDTVMAHLKREAARQGRTMSELVETALRMLLQTQPAR